MVLRYTVWKLPGLASTKWHPNSKWMVESVTGYEPHRTCLGYAWSCNVTTSQKIMESFQSVGVPSVSIFRRSKKQNSLIPYRAMFILWEKYAVGQHIFNIGSRYVVAFVSNGYLSVNQGSNFSMSICFCVAYIYYLAFMYIKCMCVCVWLQKYRPSFHPSLKAGAKRDLW